MGRYDLGTGAADEAARASGVGSTPISEVAGSSYREEAQRLIDEQVAVLFNTVEQAMPARGGPPRPIHRTEHVLTAGSGETATVFAVEAITEVPIEAEPASTFPLGQARCKVQVGGTTVDEWILSRIDRGSETPTYHWTRAETGAPITPDDILAVMRG